MDNGEPMDPVAENLAAEADKADKAVMPVMPVVTEPGKCPTCGRDR